MTMSEGENLIKEILEIIEGDSAYDGKELREGLKNTPKRVVKSWKEIYSGYNQNPKEVLNATFNGEGYDGIVLLRDIEFSQLVSTTCFLLLEKPMSPIFLQTR